MKVTVKDNKLFIEMDLAAPGTCKKVEKSGNHLIGSSSGVATVETPWGTAGMGLNMWIKPENLNKDGLAASVRRIEKAEGEAKTG